MKFTRRSLLASAATFCASPLWANAPETSLRPVARPFVEDVSRLAPEARVTSEDLIAAAGIGGQVGFVIADAATGEVLDAVDGDEALPPASVTKAVTAVYALESMGKSHRINTRLLATGPVRDGILEGDLVLAGGGDPTVQTDDLADLAAALKATGLIEIKGRFLLWGGAIPGVDEIDDTQLDHLGYNPSISGLNLNFNRVHFEWKKEGADYTVTVDARSANHRPAVSVAEVELVDRRGPVYAYAEADGVDKWTVARGALNNFGSRWLPVRYPALYCGDVFSTFARSHGIVLPKPERVNSLPEGEVIAQHQSEPLEDVLRDMMKFSTNLTAEASGILATTAQTGQRRGLRTSALSMARWVGDRAGAAPVFVDHSGLGDSSRISARDMVRLLTAPEVRDQLAPLMKDIPFVNEKRERLPNFPGRMVAKTGTLNFVSTLAGYITTGSGRELAFAVFAGDLEAREEGKRTSAERPAGSRTYEARARRLQQKLLQRWAVLADLS